MAYAAYWMSLSQPSQATPKPAAQVSTAKPAQFEKAGSAMATKPGVVTTATGGVTRSGVTAGGSASVGTAGKAKPETNTTVAGATVIDMSSAGATFVDMTSTGARSGPKEMSKTAAVSQVKATATVPSPAAGVAATRPKESPKGTAKSATATTTFNTAVPKLDTAKTTKPISTAAAGNVSVQGKKEATQTKVQVEVPPAAAKGAKEVDPFDALASILPSADPITPLLPVYTGPEVTEHDITSERGQKCGERDSTLPPGYRFEDMPPAPADYKPKDVPKPLSTDEALDSLSFGFTPSTASAAPQKQEKSQTSSAAASVSVCAPAPPADKKAKMEKVSDDFSLESLLPAVTATATKAAPPVAVCQAPPADKKAKMMDANPKTDAGVSMSLDALSALVDTLPEDKPKPELPKLRPEDIVSEDKHKKETGVFVGERDDSIAPEYRFNVDELKKLPAPKPEPTIGTGEALDFLSGDFTDSSAAPVVQAPLAKKAPAVPPVAVCPPADKKVKKENIPDDFALQAATATDDFSLDALSALSDTLPADVPKPEVPELRPEDIVSEDKHKKERGVFVGERDDSIAPEYRFNVDELKKLPAPKPEPTIGTGEALDFLSGDFTDSSAAPVVQAPSAQKHEDTLIVCYGPPPAVMASVITPVPLPTQTKVEDLSALDLLSGDFVSSTKTSGLQAPVPPPTKKTPEKTVCPLEQHRPVDVLHGRTPQAKPNQGGSLSLDALSALSDTLPEDKPKPELPKLRPEDIVSEDKHKKKKGVFVGERDDSIAPEYRFNEEQLKKLPAPEPEPTMCTGDALDILSGGFESSSAPVVQAPVITPSAPPAQSSADFSLDALAGEFVSSSAAPTVKSAVCVPTETAAELYPGADNAMDALSDTLKDITPAPQPVPPPAKDIVKEKKVVEERLVKMGERDDSLPPEYRPTKEMGEAPAPPKGKTMDDKTAMDLLSSDFGAAASKPAAPAASSAATTKLEPPVLDSKPLKPMTGAVLDSLSSTLLPDVPEFKPTDKPKGKSKSKSKSKKHQAEEPSPTEQLPAQQSSDVVPRSTKKEGKR
ncbi:calpastatin isoform X4 [Cottoperca gobio]|uniref:Calpastatin n=1 Tax=Cottoperca gobio TaxID=56716 RepID=A0A6J2PMI0_COTGO|nr:calpastatin isoform X4 [Cottoperca gobio]